ncbi:Elongation factor G [Dorcoceras hygrometricum]|uniref:Elongation factor G n=1 Tax=Dorcoceras hygrometricum TaxID=472368 RepID=A0A2Z7C3M7_9LAMI|nr:Elongation factor G [Dorcoceras hygrometricum]
MKSQQWISSFGPGPDGPLYTPPPLSSLAPPPPPPRAAAAAARLRRKIVSGRFDEENPFVQNSSVLLVQPDEGVSVLVVDRIGDYLPQSTEKSRVLVIPVGARHKCQQAADLFNHLLQIKFEIVDMLQVWKSWKRPRKEFVRQIDGKEKEIDREEKGGLAEVERLRGEEDIS